ncbi:MAG: hypothetical protein R3F31_11590 [Verrucomicrobiales bacterium]
MTHDDKRNGTTCCKLPLKWDREKQRGFRTHHAKPNHEKKPILHDQIVAILKEPMPE